MTAPAVDLPPLRDVIARFGLNASKALGQNFLLDEQLLARIAAPQSTGDALEAADRLAASEQAAYTASTSLPSTRTPGMP